MSDFDRALPVILTYEGGYINDPADPGGATNLGITQKVYNAWRSKQGLAPQDVQLISSVEVFTIYHDDYWTPAQCEPPPWPISLIHFDTAVNQGAKEAAVLLQRAARVAVDGDVGPVTLGAVAGLAEYRALAYRYLLERMWVYDDIARKNPTQYKFYVGGWTARVKALYQLVG